ncbi:MAG: peptidylprolyl isomerase, partial [Paludibacteraceae bacterium]|nr:peptidylprolyl isomerase [Paludibacteraceae bacterium]
ESKTAPKGKSLGAGDVGYTIDAEFVYPQLFHKKGALAAARTGDEVNPEKKSSGCQFYIVQGKKYSDSELNQMEKQMLMQAKNKRFNVMSRENADEVMRLRLARDQKGLMALQTKLIDELEKEFKGKKVKFTDEQREAYKTVGGTPFLDNDYTVFGEVIEGLEIIDEIAKVKTDRGDRPEDDLKMTVTVE